MTEPKISVIIPVYNAQDYLMECIESVLKQSYQDFEVICIDDGSSDRSGEILKKFAEKDKRVIIITQNNKGVSIARNKGIQQAKGKYIYFLDSDDYIEEDALEICSQALEKKALDAVYFDTIAFGEEDFSIEFIEEKNRYYARNHDYPAIYTGEELLCKLIENHEYTCNVGKQIIRRELLTDNNIIFYDGITHEDELYTIQTMLLAQRVLYIDRTLHHRRLRKNSIMTKPLEYHSVHGYFLGVKEAYRFLLKKDCNQQNLSLILGHLKRLSALARGQFSKLPESEQKKYLSFNEEDKFLFELCIADGVGTVKQRDRLNEERKDLLKEREDRKKQLADLKAKITALEQKDFDTRKTLQVSEATLARERETGKKQLADLQAKITLLEQKNVEMRKKLQASEDILAKERETGKLRLADLQAKIMLLEQKNVEMRKKLQASEDILAKERETGKLQLADLQTKVAHVEQLEAEVLNQLNEKELLLAKEHEINQKKIKELEADIVSLGQENERKMEVLKLAKIETEKILSEAREVNDRQKQELQQKDQQLNQLKKLQQQKMKQVERESEDKEKDIRRLTRHLNDVKTGWSFRIGRIITFVPRKIRDFF